MEKNFGLFQAKVIVCIATENNAIYGLPDYYMQFLMEYAQPK